MKKLPIEIKYIGVIEYEIFLKCKDINKNLRHIDKSYV